MKTSDRVMTRRGGEERDKTRASIPRAAPRDAYGLPSIFTRAMYTRIPGTIEYTRDSRR
jgi:hypothetical protein